ncbi:MAG: hypothetical protein H6700_08680 [Myxococcales bacterium]|nr:hypothetical protein [Myxococcales bacterium]MCB9520099.1 hypothetical protein [Myxococcales bacterium]MCB9531825.1 hypothetical protein [Myxococcales bacterium]
MTAEARRPLPVLPGLDSVRHVHVIGVCGTAMGTLAAMLAERGFTVSGSDAMAYPPMSTWLEARGLTVQSGYAAEHIPPHTDLVVVGNIARRDNVEAVAAGERGLPCVSLPEALRVFFFPGRTALVATGTHGKTTTSAMTAWILFQTRRDPSFFIGGVTANFDANYRLGSGTPFVVEGDEYDTAYFDKVPKFWHYPAKAATINNVEFDHADIYPDLDAVRHVFSRFAAQIPRDGALWVNGDDDTALACAAHARCAVRRFGLHADPAASALDLAGAALRTHEGGTDCLVARDGLVHEVTLPTIGDYNLRNFLGAAGLASEVGVTLAEACAAIGTFRGVKKRQELKGVVADIPVIDDFAHHPTAVRSTLAALRMRYPTRRIWAIFEAKSNTSRRAVFQQAYAEAFADADIVVLSQPWKKDDLPEDQLLSLPRLVADLERAGKEVHLIPDVDAIVDFVAPRARPGDAIAGLSGSAFGGLHQKLIDALKSR